MRGCSWRRLVLTGVWEVCHGTTRWPGLGPESASLRARDQSRSSVTAVNPRLLRRCRPEKGGWSRLTWLAGCQPPPSGPTPTLCANPHFLDQPPPSAPTPTFWDAARQKGEVGPGSRGWRAANPHPLCQPPLSVPTPTFWDAARQKGQVACPPTPTFCADPHFLCQPPPSGTRPDRTGRLVQAHVVGGLPTPTFCADPHLLCQPPLSGTRPDRKGRLAGCQPPPSAPTSTFWDAAWQKTHSGVALDHPPQPMPLSGVSVGTPRRS